MLNDGDWVKLLLKHPDKGFAEYCDWFKLDEEDWNALLKKCPQFADKCVEMGFDVPEHTDSEEEETDDDDFSMFMDEDSGETFISVF